MTDFISKNAERSEHPHPAALKLAQASARLKPLNECTPEEARAMRAERGNPFAPPACDLAAIENIIIECTDGSLAARVYRPHLGDQDTELQPALIYFHGGGFVLGDIAQYDTVTQQLASWSGCIVISVEYRLAPAVKSAQIYGDGIDALKWVYRHSKVLGIDKQRIAIGGDSAGANLTIAVALRCKQQQIDMPAFQLLIYPVTDYTMSFASIDEFADGYFLTKASMLWFRDHLLENAERITHPEVSSLRAELSGLPPAFVLTAGFDPLRDEGKAFADRLERHGVTVEHLCYTDMIHGFISFAGGIPPGMEALQKMGSVLKTALAK